MTPKALIISKDNVLSSVYYLNLYAYVNVSSLILKSIDQLEGVDAAITESIEVVALVKSKNTSVEEECAKINLRLPNASIVTLGKGLPPNDAIDIPNKFKVRELLRACARILEITPKMMAELVVSEYFPIPIALIREMETSNTALYLKSGEESYTVAIDRGVEIEGKLKSFIDAGVSQLFVKSEERLKFINFSSSQIIKQLNNPKLDADERLMAASTGMDIVGEEIFENGGKITAEIAKVSSECIKTVEKTVKEFPSLEKLLNALVESKTEYVYLHSILCTYITANVIEKLPWGSKEQAEKLAFVLFFHDIYLTPIYKKYPESRREEDLMFNQSMSENEKKLVLEHARMASDLVKTFPKAPMGSDMIICQHHGMTSGVGIAINYKDDISPLSKVIIICEYATDRVLEYKDRGEKVDKQAIVNDMSQKFVNHTYKKIIKHFAQIEL